MKNDEAKNKDSQDKNSQRINELEKENSRLKELVTELNSRLKELGDELEDSRCNELGALAVQLLQIHSPALSSALESGMPLSDEKLDRHFRDALARARWLREGETGVIHLYQLFREGDPHMTYESISKYVKKKAKWPNPGFAANTLRKKVPVILKHAHENLKKYTNAHHQGATFWPRSSVTPQKLRFEITRFTLRILEDNGILSGTNADDVAEKLSAMIIREVGYKLARGPWHPPTYPVFINGRGSFAGYVLQPPDFDKFLDETRKEEKNLGPMRCFYTPPKRTYCRRISLRSSRG